MKPRPITGLKPISPVKLTPTFPASTRSGSPPGAVRLKPKSGDACPVANPSNSRASADPPPPPPPVEQVASRDRELFVIARPVRLPQDDHAVRRGNRERLK